MDTTTQFEMAKALAVIDTLGRNLPTEEALNLFRHVGTRQEALRKRLSREGAFKTTIAQSSGIKVLSAVSAVKVG